MCMAWGTKVFPLSSLAIIEAIQDVATAFAEMQEPNKEHVSQSMSRLYLK